MKGRYTPSEHSQAVRDLITALDYLTGQPVPDEHARRSLHELCSARADELAMGHGMSEEDWETICNYLAMLELV